MPNRPVIVQINHAFHLVGALVFLATALFGTVASAQTPQASGPNTLLSPLVVGNFIAAYAQVQERLDSFSGRNVAPEVDSSGDSLNTYLAYQQASDELDDIVARFGFDSFRDWVQTSTAIVTAFTFFREGGALDARIDEAIAEIESNPNFSTEQKVVMLAQMDTALQSVTALRPDQANIEAVAAHEAALADLFD